CPVEGTKTSSCQYGAGLMAMLHPFGAFGQIRQRRNRLARRSMAIAPVPQQSLTSNDHLLHTRRAAADGITHLPHLRWLGEMEMHRVLVLGRFLALGWLAWATPAGSADSQATPARQAPAAANGRPTLA